MNIGSQATEARSLPVVPARNIHLLYVPTLNCNLACTYCYLGDQTRQAPLREDAARAVDTLRHTLAALEEAGVLAFNVSLHGGEVTTLPEAVLDELFTLIRSHYLRHFDALTALGHRKSSPHIKTNLYKFASLAALFDRHRVSISASIDLPLALHERYRLTRKGGSWGERTLENLRLLAKYPHAKKISATLSAEHLADVPALVRDIWFIHRELGLDMNQMNLMFAFSSALNRERHGDSVLTPCTPQEQLQLYDALHEAFIGTELEEGLRRNWFDEFKPSYCTNSVNCGERFYLLQSDGNVYSCVRGQGLEELHYGNVFTDSIDAILQTGARKVAALHQAFGFDAGCQGCGHLSQCNTGCPVVKLQNQSARSYTCDLQKTIYRDNPRSYPVAGPEEIVEYAQAYARRVHPALVMQNETTTSRAPRIVLPSDLWEERNALVALIEADPLLGQLYADDVFVLEVGEEVVPLTSQILREQRVQYTLTEEDRLVVHVRRSLFDAACSEPVRNTLYLQMLRDTPIVYGDEKRTKQEHVFTWQLFFNCLEPSDRLGEGWLMADLGGLVALHKKQYRRGVVNNLFFTTGQLRDYHYQKQRNNAFYHIQAMNLPFQNFEFHYLG